MAIVVLALLTILSLLPGVHLQDTQTLSLLNFQEKQTYLDAFNDYPYLQDELHNIMHDLWTVYLPELLWKNSSKLSPGCVKSVENLIPGLRENSSSDFPVSPKMLPLLDATGKQGAGLLSGNMILDGAYDECFSYNYTGYCLAYPVNPDIPGMQKKFPLSWMIGLCVPKYCTNYDISFLINHTIFKVSEDAVKCKDSKIPGYSAGAIAMIVVTTVFVAMVVAGTVLDVLLQYITSLSKYDDDEVSVKASLSVDRGTSENVPLIQPKKDNVLERIKPWDFITAFSLFKTVPTLLATKQAPSVITSLNGLRVISMFWVILGHTYFTILTPPGNVDNPVVMRSVLSRFSFQAIGNGFFSVESFFFLTGVLVSYLSLREMKKKNGRFPLLQFYIHRYLRLTPSYAFVLFFAWALYVHMAYSPAISLGKVIDGGDCAKYWWTNLLYINNFYPWTQKEFTACLGWSWYLANDMQLYIMSPLILVPLYHLLPLALLIVAALLLCSFIVTATLVGVYDLQSNIFAEVAYNNSILTPTNSDYFDLVYVKPWSHVAPYLVGMVLGYMLYKEFHFSFGLKKNVFAYLLLWVVSGVILTPDVYGLYSIWHGHIPGKFENIAYVTLSRFAWGIGLALMVFACHNGYGWFINSFLSMKMWVPLSRMTYTAYLVHPLLLIVIYRQFQKTFHYTDITIAFFYVGFVVLSYGVAGLVCLLVEFPLATVEMLVFKVVEIKSRQKQVVVAMSDNEGGKQKIVSTKNLLTKSRV